MRSSFKSFHKSTFFMKHSRSRISIHAWAMKLMEFLANLSAYCKIFLIFVHINCNNNKIMFKNIKLTQIVFI